MLVLWNIGIMLVVSSYSTMALQSMALKYTSRRLPQSSNAPPSIVFSCSGSVIFLMFEHPLKAYLPMFSIVAGSVKSLSRAQSVNAKLGIDFTLLPNVRFMTAQLLNARVFSQRSAS